MRDSMQADRAMDEEIPTLRKYRRVVDEKLGRYNYHRKRNKELVGLLDERERGLLHLNQSLEFFQEVAKNVQEDVHRKVCGIVTRCLEVIFDDPYTFTIQFDKKRSKTEARILLCRDGQEYDPAKSVAGGVIDVVSFALRLVSVVLSRPQLRQVLILDEPFKHLSAEYRERVGILLQELNEKMGIQFILITHHSELEIGKVITI